MTERLHPSGACLQLDCPNRATVHVKGRFPGETIGWDGDYCPEHSVEVVQHQLFQVAYGLKITMEPLP